MNPIRAFVGHSFTPDDDAVITAFLRYFDQVQKLHPTFSWVNAKVAEPTELARKVLGLVEGKNVFVGICTKKERVVASDKIIPTMFSRDRMQARVEDIEWKTSDWIIQEIGMAVGRDMSVILLLEEGCRKPGGLQGDVEFIPFERSNPERAFGRLLEMITAIAPPDSLSETASTTESAATSSEDEPATPSEVSDDVPDESWDYQRFENALVWKIFSNDEVGAASIEHAYFQTPEAADPEKEAEWRSMAFYWRLLLGRGRNIGPMKELRLKHPDNSQVIKNFAGALENIGNHVQAAEEYENAADKTADRVEAERLRGKAAVQYAKNDQSQIAYTKLNAQRVRVLSHADEELNLLSAMKEVADILKDIPLQLHIMERLCELRPDDWDNRFNLAFLYSNNGYNDLSLLNYTKIPSGERTAIAWNNLGVAFQSFSMPAKSVEAYRRAASSEETLAMSNLAYKFMEVGFVEEAKTELKRALNKKDYHRNVGQAMTNLQDIEEKENKNLESTLETMKPKSKFFKKLGLAVVAPDALLDSAIWKGPDCPLALQVNDGRIIAIGNYEKKQSSLATALSGGTKVDKYDVRYDGKVIGRRAIGTVQRKLVGDTKTTSLLSMAGNDDLIEFMMVIDATGDKISVVEKPTSTTPRFYELLKSQETGSILPAT